MYAACFPFNNKIKKNKNDSGEKTAVKKACDHADVDKLISSAIGTPVTSRLFIQCKHILR